MMKVISGTLTSAAIIIQLPEQVIYIAGIDNLLCWKQFAHVHTELRANKTACELSCQLMHKHGGQF